MNEQYNLGSTEFNVGYMQKRQDEVQQQALYIAMHVVSY